MVTSPNFRGHSPQCSATHARQEALEALAETLPNFVWTCDGEGNKTFCNRRYLDYLGVSSIEEMTTGWSAMVHPDDRMKAVSAWTGALANGETYFAEYRMRHCDGSYRSSSRGRYRCATAPVASCSGSAVRQTS